MESKSEPRSERLSRRDLFGGGIGRAFDARVAAVAAAKRSHDSEAAPVAAPLPFSWGEGRRAPGALGSLVEPAARALLEACAVPRASRLVDASAGDGQLTELAAHAGAIVTAFEPDPALRERGRRRSASEAPSAEWCVGSPIALRYPDGAADAVVSCFGVSHHFDAHAAGQELARVASSGAPIALTAWTGLMPRVMAAGAPDRNGRSELWTDSETSQQHFPGWLELRVEARTLEWSFVDAAHALAALAEPVAGTDGEARIRRLMPDLIAEYGDERDGELVLRSDYALIFARKP